MRIGMMADMYKPYISGVTTYISLNKKFLEKMGHEVFVFTFGNGRFPDDELNVVRSPGLPIKRGEIYMNLFYSPSSFKLLRTMDILHVQHPFISGFIAFTSSQLEKTPIVFTNHTRYDIYSRLYLKSFLYSITSRILKYYFFYFYKRLDSVIVPSQSMVQVIQKCQPAARLVVVPHGMELDLFYRRTTTLDRSKFGLDPEDVVLIYVGRLWPEKNLPFLIQSFARVEKIHHRARLLLVGDGTIRRKLENQVAQAGLSSKVLFIGAIPHDQLPAYYAMADFFVTPSYSETFGLTVVEAMASGLPVLGVDSAGTSDTVNQGITGFLSENQIESFVEKMEKLIVDRELRLQMGKNALQESAKYRIENSVEQLLNVYLQAIEFHKVR